MSTGSNDITLKVVNSIKFRQYWIKSQHSNFKFTALQLKIGVHGRMKDVFDYFINVMNGENKYVIHVSVDGSVHLSIL